jgi:hypothetical protein
MVLGRYICVSTSVFPTGTLRDTRCWEGGSNLVYARSLWHAGMWNIYWRFVYTFSDVNGGRSI